MVITGVVKKADEHGVDTVDEDDGVEYFCWYIWDTVVPDDTIEGVAATVEGAVEVPTLVKLPEKPIDFLGDRFCN